MSKEYMKNILYILYEEKKYTINILYFFGFRVVALNINFGFWIRILVHNQSCFFTKIVKKC